MMEVCTSHDQGRQDLPGGLFFCCFFVVSLCEQCVLEVTFNRYLVHL